MHINHWLAQAISLLVKRANGNPLSSCLVKLPTAHPDGSRDAAFLIRCCKSDSHHVRRQASAQLLGLYRPRPGAKTWLRETLDLIIQVPTTIRAPVSLTWVSVDCRQLHPLGRTVVQLDTHGGVYTSRVGRSIHTRLRNRFHPSSARNPTAYGIQFQSRAVVELDLLL